MLGKLSEEVLNCRDTYKGIGHEQIWLGFWTFFYFI